MEAPSIPHDSFRNHDDPKWAGGKGRSSYNIIYNISVVFIAPGELYDMEMIFWEFHWKYTCHHEFVWNSSVSLCFHLQSQNFHFLTFFVSCALFSIIKASFDKQMRHSPSMATQCPPTDVDRHFTDTSPTLHRHFTDTLPTLPSTGDELRFLAKFVENWYKNSRNHKNVSAAEKTHFEPSFHRHSRINL